MNYKSRDLGRAVSVRRWTIDAINCYKRGCMCKGCFYDDFFKSDDSRQKCQMKAAVLELVRVVGVPEGLQRNDIVPENAQKQVNAKIKPKKQKYIVKAEKPIPPKWWQKNQVEYLKEHWGSMPIPEIAKNLNKSVNAVKLKAQRIKLKRFIHSGEYITYNQLMILINSYQMGAYDKKIMKAGFPLRYKTAVNNRVKIVYMDDFWAWFEDNKHLIELSRTHNGTFGYEPAWVDEKRKADKRAAEYKTTPWTSAEENKLIILLKEMKWGYREISIKLKRSEGAIKRRMIDLKIKLRPLRADNHNPWTEDEIETVRDLYSKGYKSCIIAEYINRSALAINGLLERHKYFKKEV